MTRVQKTLTLPLLALMIGACGSDTPTDPTASNVTIKADPDPIVAVASTDATYAWKATANLTLSEDAGVGLTVGAVRPSIAAASGGIVVVTTDAIKASSPQVRASGNRINSKGSIALSIEFLYTRADGGKEALVTVDFSFTDDNGYTYTRSAQFKVV